MSDTNHTQGVSPELDALSCDLLGSALDALAAGERVLAVVAVEDAAGSRDMEAFEDDGPDVCIEGARDYVVRASHAAPAAIRYAIVYEGAVADEAGAYVPALLLEFGEQGSRCAYSAFVLVDGIGQGEVFTWSDPQPAGEVQPLL